MSLGGVSSEDNVHDSSGNYNDFTYGFALDLLLGSHIIRGEGFDFGR